MIRRTVHVRTARWVQRGAGAVLLLAGACSGPQPTRTPLSPPSAEPRAPRRSSSRAPLEGEPSKEPEPEPEVEIDADDGDEPDRVSSGATAGQCAFQQSRGGVCARLSASGKGACAGSIATRACETWGPYLDGRVVEKWLSCLSKPPVGVAACDGTQTLRCALGAVGAACVDPALGERCARLSAACEDSLPELTRSVCTHVLSSFSPGKRTEIADCLQHGCDTGAFGSCIP